MVHTGMVGMVVCGGDKERDVQSTAAVLNEIGVGGLSVEAWLSQAAIQQQWKELSFPSRQLTKKTTDADLAQFHTQKRLFLAQLQQRRGRRHRRGLCCTRPGQLSSLMISVTTCGTI